MVLEVRCSPFLGNVLENAKLIMFYVGPKNPIIAPPERRPDAVREIQTTENTVFLYRLVFLALRAR